MGANVRCPKCGKEAILGQRFCGACGAELPKPYEASIVGEEGVYHCYRHKNEVTRVTCGRCERPICTKCMVMGPAGVRCPDCAKNKVPIRPKGVLHDVGSGAKGVARTVGARPIWYLWIFQIIANFIRGFFR